MRRGAVPVTFLIAATDWDAPNGFGTKYLVRSCPACSASESEMLRELGITRRSTRAMLRVRGRTSRGAGPSCLSDIKVASACSGLGPRPASSPQRLNLRRARREEALHHRRRRRYSRCRDAQWGCCHRRRCEWRRALLHVLPSLSHPWLLDAD
jgi:hypothetical protein